MHSARTALKMFATMTILTGLIYPLLITLIAQFTMPKQAGGSIVYSGDKIIGSELIAQSFKGNAYFWPRPSAVDFDPLKPAGGSNLGPTSQKLKEMVQKRVEALGSNPPPELVYTSGSGIDPHINIETAYYQMERVAKSRSIQDVAQVKSLIDSLAEGIKKNYVNVLLLNQALDQQFPIKHP